MDLSSSLLCYNENCLECIVSLLSNTIYYFQMIPDINSKCDIMVEVLGEKTKGGKSVDIKK